MIKDVGEWAKTGMFDYAAMVTAAEEALEAAKRLNVKGVPGRFTEYFPLLRAAANFNSSPLPWPIGSRERALFYEGAVQVSHLLKAATIWPHLPRNDARHKLTKALAGNALPDPTSDIDRQARDFMVEFATASVLKQRGLAVTMPNGTGREDVRVAVPKLGELLIEVKRPKSIASIHDKLREGWEKFRSDGPTRCDGKTTFGMVVIAIDRLLHDAIIPAAFNDAVDVPSFRSHNDLRWWIDREFRRRVVESVAAEVKARRTFYPEIPFVALLLSIHVFVNEDASGGYLHLIDILAPYNTGPSWDAVTKLAFFGTDAGGVTTVPPVT